MANELNNVRLPQGQQARGVRILVGAEASARRRILECLHQRS
jgi:hypothetical protein